MEYIESHRKKIIVSADDFGVSPLANSSIFELIRLDKIDRVGIMVHGKISLQEIEILARSGIKLDIHLDILHEFNENRSHRQSAIFRVLEFLSKFATGKISPKAVAADWEKQINLFHKIFGRYPDGLNSHEHVHFFPPFFKIALKLRNKYHIPYIRFGDSIFIRHSAPVAIILHTLRKINLKKCLDAGCISSNSLVSLDWIENVAEFLNNLPEGTVEIACHPELIKDFEKIEKYF